MPFVFISRKSHIILVLAHELSFLGLQIFTSLNLFAQVPFTRTGMAQLI